MWASEEVLFPTLAALLGYELAENPCNGEYVQWAAAHSMNDVARCLSLPEAYWIHPVERTYDDPVRTAIRAQTHAGIYQPLSGSAPMENTTENTTENTRDHAEPIETALAVDGLHDYPNVARHCLSVEETVIEGGVIAFHDYSPDYPDVVTFVQELIASGRFSVVAHIGSLVTLRKHRHATARIAPNAARNAVDQAHSALDAPSAPSIRRSAPLVSCIMPTSNRPEWIQRAIHCFDRQDFFDRQTRGRWSLSSSTLAIGPWKGYAAAGTCGTSGTERGSRSAS